MGSSNHYFFMFSELMAVMIIVAASLACVWLMKLIFAQEQPTMEIPIAIYENPTGACGFGEYGRRVNNGEVSAVSRLYRNGSGCGACYQVRCKIPAQCNEEGTEVVGAGDNIDFILSPVAYAKLAKPNMGAELFAYGVFDVEYRRIPCRYDRNLKIKVHEESNFPNYLAVLPIYQSGMYDITAVQIWQEDCKEWGEMQKVYGAVWDMQNPMKEVEINLRIQLTATANTIVAVIPSDWKYDAAIQLN